MATQGAWDSANRRARDLVVMHERSISGSQVTKGESAISRSQTTICFWGLGSSFTHQKRETVETRGIFRNETKREGWSQFSKTGSISIIWILDCF